MAKQNIYDNDSFFENFKNLRNNKINFNDCIETPILLAMIPEVDGKRVLDIGCGMGQHAKQYSDMGAESVLAIDISEKMLEYFCACCLGLVRCPFIQSRHSVLAGMLPRKPAPAGNSLPAAGRREGRNPSRCTRSSGTRGIRSEDVPLHSVLPLRKVQ